MMADAFIASIEAARLIQCDVRSVQRRIEDGRLNAIRVATNGAGRGGYSYMVDVHSLPPEAQLRYYISQADDASVMNADLVGYQERFGEEGLAELLTRQKAVLALQGMRNSVISNMLEQINRLAADLNTTPRTLYRWEKQYQSGGLSALMRKGRKDAGESRTMCLEARRFILTEYLSEKRRKQDAILSHLKEHARDMGFDACFECPYREGSENRDALRENGEIEHYPACDQPGQGIIIPGHRSSINRLISAVPDEVKSYIRDGRKPWKAAYRANVVSYQGSSYMAFGDVKGVLPTDASKWLLMASKGDSGDGSGDMLLSDFGGSGPGIVGKADTAENAENLDGKGPEEFAGALHAAQHAVGGADPIAPASLNVVARETSNPAWISMPLLNDFTGEVLCMKDAYGWVHVKGSVTRSAVPPASTRLFELPVGYRPARWFSGLLTQTGADNTLWATGMIISISGGVETSSFTPPSNFSTTRSIYLVGAVFKASL